VIVAHGASDDMQGGCPSCFAELVADRVLNFRPIEKGMRRLIADAAAVFHERNETTTYVARPLAEFRDGAPVIRFAHQPNLFPYLGVLGQFLFVHNISRLAADIARQSVVPAYFVVDYDEAGDRRFHKTLLPDPRSRHGAAALSYQLARKDRRKAAFTLDAPGQSVTDGWLNIFDRWTERYRTTSRSFALQPLTEVGVASARNSITELLTAYRKHRTFSDGNAAHLSTFINATWRLPILFIPLSASAAGLERHFMDLSGRLNEKEDSRATYAWYICPNCCTRTAVSAHHAASSLQCGFCGRREEGVAHSAKVPNVPATGRARPRIVPKVLMDNLADYELYGVVAGTGYAGGLAHMRRSRDAAQRMGIATAELGVRFSYQQEEQPCDPEGDGSRTNSLVRSGRSSMLYYLSTLGIDSLKRELHSSFFRSSCLAHGSQEERHGRQCPTYSHHE
jgi:hypothetical protein